jgi:outer membrane murein-binding lipoprotein Lpp
MSADINAPEPAPIPTNERPLWDVVIEAMRQRDAIGRTKYGTPLQAGNGRRMIIDAAQDALDLVVYLFGEAEQRKQLEAQLDDWKDASGLECGGDPDGVTPEHLRKFIADLEAELAQAQAERDALAKFKAYVHERLDGAGVPANPEPPKHALEGCRIGDRLDWILRQYDETAAKVGDLEGDRDALRAELKAQQECSDRQRRKADDAAGHVVSLLADRTALRAEANRLREALEYLVGEHGRACSMPDDCGALRRGRAALATRISDVQGYLRLGERERDELRARFEAEQARSLRIVGALERAETASREVRADRDVLFARLKEKDAALQLAAAAACSLWCPWATARGGELPHHPNCQKVRAALTAEVKP